MEYIEELVNKINRRMTPKEAYELNNIVCGILKSKNYDDKIKSYLKDNAMLEPLSMLASCYDETKSSDIN